MGRQPRFDPPGGWHHVMNRGAARQTVFHTDEQRSWFEELLSEGHERYGVEVHAFCLMSNHYHLLAHCPDGQLSVFMRRLCAQYTRQANHDLGRDGPLFRGRFRSILIDSERYLASVGRYIHRNPLDIRPPVDLATYRWSSLRHYCDPGSAPTWMRLTTLSAGWAGPDEYRAFVEADVAHTSGGIAWAIATALVEHVDDAIVDRANIDRTIALRMTEIAPALLDAVERWLAFPTGEARRAARARARSRLAELPALELVARRAVELAAVGTNLAPSVVTKGA